MLNIPEDERSMCIYLTIPRILFRVYGEKITVRISLNKQRKRNMTRQGERGENIRDSSMKFQ